MIEGAVVCWSDVDLAVSALNNRLQADERFSTCSLGIEYCEILASSTEMFSSAANLGHLQCHFLLLLSGNPVLPWSFKLVALFLKVQLCQTSTVYRLKLFVMGIRFKSFGISVKAVAYSF